MYSTLVDTIVSGLAPGTNSSRSIDVSDLRILDKRQKIVSLKPNRVQKDLLGSLTGRDLVLKSRQQGISTGIQAQFFCDAVNKTCRVGTLAHDDETTQKLRDMQQMFYDELPDDLQSIYPRAINNATRAYYPRTKSMVYIGTAGNTQRGRGGTYSHLHGSEVAFWKDAAQVMAGILQGVPEGGQIVLESTANGAQGWFYEQCMAALRGDSEWTLHFYPWWHDAEYSISLEADEQITYTDDERRLVESNDLSNEQIKWRRKKQRELGRDFLQEYPEDPYTCFLTSGNSYFGNLEHVFTAPANVAIKPDGRFIAGLDFGQTIDSTVMIVLDEDTFSMVDLLWINRMEWQEMRRRISVLANRWNARVIGEANSMGKTNIELLQRGEVTNTGIEIAKVRLTPFNTTPQSKPLLIQGLHHGLHESGLALMDVPELKHQLGSFISKQTTTGHWVYEAASGAHDDFVIALALAWHGINMPIPRSDIW